jgi:beta-mannosidase
MYSIKKRISENIQVFIRYLSEITEHSKCKLFSFLLILLVFSSCNTNPVRPLKADSYSSVPAFSQIRDGASFTDSIDLNGRWQFKSTEQTDWMDARVPGIVQSDLLRAGKIKDPFYRDNEFDAQWVEKKEWEYQRTFNVDPAFLDHENILLDCRGLDVICEVYLNDTLVAKTKNMFIENKFDIKKYLHPGVNIIRVLFHSVLDWNRQMAESDPRVTWNRGENATTDGLKGLLFFSRKEASDFGWDWGIRLLSCGIWRPIRVVAYDTGRILELAVRQDLTNPSEAKLSIKADIETYHAADLNVNIVVSLEDITIVSKSLPIVNSVASGEVIIPDPKLWWPNGWGKHPLYTVKAELFDKDKLVNSRVLRIGLRTITVKEEKDECGLTFGFLVNGKPIFCKGGNWVPADAFPDRLTEARYKELLGSCVEANMNMIRLWGGGLYEPDVFYDFCDENGIMIWHDFMFASGPYLAVDSYLENVREEIRNVVLRLRHHPSIAVWCGNNESEYNMAGGQNWLKNFPTTSWADFDEIFYETIPQTAASVDPDRPYFPSSPYHPLDREQKYPDWETSSGTVHTYEVWSGEKRFDAFSEMGKYRFVSEFGYQSLPHPETVRAFTAQEDRFFPSVIIDQHNLVGRKPDQNQGNVRIITNMANMFRLSAGMENWITVSQILQGEGIKMGCEALRRNFPKSTGALYWQLDDNWPVISWSSIDYFGRWKALQYMAKRFFSPVLVSGVVENDSVIVYGSSDLLTEEFCKLEWTVSGFDGKDLKKGSVDVIIPPFKSVILEKLNLSEFVRENPELSTYRKESYRNRERFFLSLKLIQGDSLLSSNVIFFVPPKYWRLEDPKIKYIIASENGKKKIVLSTDRFAAYVELGLEHSYAKFSDNFFHLIPGERKSVYVLSSELPEKEFIKHFYVKSLIDTYTTFRDLTDN